MIWLQQYVKLHQAGSNYFTCITVSESYIVCGSQSGSVYFYKRKSYTNVTLLKMIPPLSKERNAVSCIRISCDEKVVAVGTWNGYLYGISLTSILNSKSNVLPIFEHNTHKGYPITALIWDRNSRLYAGCNGGKVTLTKVRVGMAAYFGTSMSELLLQEESGIVQLDCRKGSVERLLVSSLTRVLVVNLEGGKVVQVGTKLRQGKYGACFGKEEVDVIAVRPGKRIWLAKAEDGKVEKTIKFVTQFESNKFIPTLQENVERNKLGPFAMVFRMSLEDGLCLAIGAEMKSYYLIDLNRVEVVEWHEDLGIIHDVALLEDSTIVFLHGKNRVVSYVQHHDMQSFQQALSQYDTIHAVQLALRHTMTDIVFLKWLKEDLVNKQEESPLVEKLTAWINECSVASVPDVNCKDKVACENRMPSNARRVAKIEDLPDADPVIDQRMVRGMKRRTGLRKPMPTNNIPFSGYIPGKDKWMSLGVQATSDAASVFSSMLPRNQANITLPENVEQELPQKMDYVPVLKTAMSVDAYSTDQQVAILMQAIATRIAAKPPLLPTYSPKQPVEEPAIPSSLTKMQTKIPTPKKPIEKQQIVDDIVKLPKPKSTYKKQTTIGAKPSLVAQKVQPSCKVEFRSFLSCKFFSTSTELNNIGQRDITDLEAEVSAAAMAATNQPHLATRIWPASGITKVTACLCHLYMHYSNLTAITIIVESWLKCFNPSSKDASCIERGHVDGDGWHRAQALVGGDGLPLTRNDWYLVRYIATLYARIKIAGKFIVMHHNAKEQVDVQAKLGMSLGTCPTIPEPWTHDEVLHFLTRYETYFDVEDILACCNAVQNKQAMEHVMELGMQNANNIEQVIEFNRLRVEESEDAVLAAEMKTLSLCSLLQLLEKLLQKHPTIAIQECVQRFPNIRPWNVRRTVKASGEKYVQYISNLLTSRNDIITIEYAVHALLHIDISKMHHHCTTWPSIALQQTTTSITPNSEIWSKLSIPLLIDVQSSLLIVYILESIHADDIYQKALVDHLAVLQKFPKQHLVQFIQKTISKLSIKWLQLTIQTLNDHIDTISTSTIAEIFTLLQSHLHPPQVLQICTACPSFTASISFPAFQKLFSIEQVEKRKIELCGAMVEEIDASLWSSPPTHVLPPQILFVLDNEKRSQNFTPEYFFTTTDQSNYLTGTSRASLLANHEWGKHLPLYHSTILCKSCQLPILPQSNIDSMILSCGHEFHLECIFDFECPACPLSDMDSLFQLIS